MLAYSAKKYHEPVVEDDHLTLCSCDGETELRVFVPVKYIFLDNKAKIFRPKKTDSVSSPTLRKKTGEK